MKGSEYVRQIQDVVVNNVGWTGGVEVSATWLTQKLGIVAQHMIKLEKYGEDLIRERDEWKAVAKQWQEYAESLEGKKDRKVQIAAARARVAVDKRRGVETEQWIVDLANEGD